jgi:hypothetical protein
MVFRRIGQCVAASTVLLLLAAGARAQSLGSLVFDFEDLAATWATPGVGPTNRQGTYGTFNPLVYTKGNVTVTVQRFLTVGFDIVFNDNNLPNGPFQGDKPASWGNKSLDPFVNITSGTPPPTAGSPMNTTVTASAYWIFDFNVPVQAASIDFGDYGSASNDTDQGNLRAFFGTDMSVPPLAFGEATQSAHTTDEVLSTTVSLNAGSNRFTRLTFESISNGGLATNNVFLDNLQIVYDVVPEPGTVALLAPMLLGGVLTFRRRKA